ncbi:UDP-N-acetylglucosamine 1-carboxyvinyltransferase [Carboxydocella thermautotrophica]|nr:UDP-N-acetylglucosamine 1-carboxyvinyltransferase [Carboxydocella thermautotrophica]
MAKNIIGKTIQMKRRRALNGPAPSLLAENGGDTRVTVLKIRGGVRLEGKVRVSGAKNAALTAISAAMLATSPVYLENMPQISDVLVMLDIIRLLGAEVSWDEPTVVRIVPPEHPGYDTPYELVKKLRASNLLLGSLLPRTGRAHIALPGGCNIGSRPMDLHIKGLGALGAEVELSQGYIKARVRNGLQGAKIYLDFPSVGATENLMMAAATAKGQTIIENAAKEPEIVDLANFLNAMGAKIRGAGTDVIKIEGVKALQGTRYAIIPDRIEAGTYMVAAAATDGDVTIENVIPTHVEPVTAKLKEMGVRVIEEDDVIRVISTGTRRPVDIKTMPYPGFPTDMQSQMMALLAVTPGVSMVTENVFENRMQLADELKRMGARIKIQGRTAVVEGIERLEGAQVRATDLRAGAALIIAGLVAEGITEIDNVHYIDRGYENLEEKFNGLGAGIWREIAK